MNKFSDNFFDFSAFNSNSKNIAIEKKISYLHEQIGGSFWDKDKELITGSVSKIIAIGGLPISIEKEKPQILGHEISKDSILDALAVSSGTSAFMSYLNPSNHDLAHLGDLVVNKHKHLSVLHTFSVSILLSGISIGVENEFSCQRDIVHLSRVTVAKTKAQDSPCLVCRNEKFATVYKDILHYTKQKLVDNNEIFNDKEDRNLLFPTAKSSAVILTGSIKNILKLTSLAHSGGKEDEFVEALGNIEKIIKNVFDI